MKKLKSTRIFFIFFLILLFPLTACSEFTGLRTPFYDGALIKLDKEAIEVYQARGEIIGAEKEFYIRHSFSEAIIEPSLAYPDEEIYLLEEGRFVIGKDIPAGRATLLGNESVFTSENYEVHLGNLIVRDEVGEFYFENLFHSEYGQLTAQIDLIEGHEIEVIGTNPEISIFYSEILPENPYLLMELPQLLQNLGRIDFQQAIEVSADEKTVNLTAGIYEVGVHFPAGKYEIANLQAPHNTEMYIFQESNQPRVIELLLGSQFEDKLEPNEEFIEKKNIQIEFFDGDKIYLNLVNHLKLICLTND